MLERGGDREGKRHCGECMRGVARMEEIKGVRRRWRGKVIGRKGKLWDEVEVRGEVRGVSTGVE